MPRAAEDASLYSLEFRVSLDGFTPTENDAIRGPGTFERILGGIRMLTNHGFLPIVTVTQTRDDDDQRHTGDLQAGHVEPGLRDLVGADLVARSPDRVEAAKDRHRGQGDDDGRDLSPGDDKAVDQASDTPDRACGRQADTDVESRIGLNHAGRHIG